jgi:hypothetical protein
MGWYPVDAGTQHDPNRPEDVLKVDADEDGVGGDDTADCNRPPTPSIFFFPLALASNAPREPTGKRETSFAYDDTRLYALVVLQLFGAFNPTIGVFPFASLRNLRWIHHYHPSSAPHQTTCNPKT